MGVESAWIQATEGLKDVEKWWPRLVEAYSSQERRYHDLQHLERKIELLQELGGTLDSRTLTLAILFQYYEYNPQEGDSADKNVEHFKSFAADSGIDAEVTAKVEALLSTEGSSDDRAFLQDLDMAALGSPPEQYSELKQKIREEYSFLSDDSYKTLRRKILQSFLLIPNIFTTDSFRDKFETQARVNIEEEVASMGKS